MSEEARKITAAAEARDIGVAPHAPLGPINLAASLQLDFCTPNAVIQETSMGIHYHEGQPDLLDYVSDRSVFRLQDGAFARTDAPGLGVEIDEAAVRQAAEAAHRWHNAVGRHDDGGIAEW